MLRSLLTRQLVEIVGVPPTGAKSGQKTVAAPGTAVPLATSRVINCGLIIKALAGNTNKVYIGNDGAGDVTSANGFELSAGEVTVIDYIENIASIIVDAAVAGEGVSWTLLYY